MSSVVLLTGFALCHNPRAFKEASALAAAGHEVEVLGAWLDAELKARDLEMLPGLPFKFTPVLDATRDKSTWNRCRVRVKTARLWQQFTGGESRWQLGYPVDLLTQCARKRKADLFIAHSEAGMFAASKLFQAGRPVGVDMEDWYSEDLPPATRKHRPIRLLRRLEQQLLTTATHRTCTSRAMDRELCNEFKCQPATVIYNAFPWADREQIDSRARDRQNHNLPSLHWYSQTLGTDRGLTDLFAALPLVKHDLEIHLRGRPSPGFEAWLSRQVPEPWRRRICIHGLVTTDELLSRIAEHDMGFAGEEKHCRSRDLTVTNKILHYLLGGLAVVASDTAGQKEVAEKANGAVKIYPSGDANALANQLNLWLSSPESLRAARAAALAAAETQFCWERQVPIFLESVSRSVST